MAAGETIILHGGAGNSKRRFDDMHALRIAPGSGRLSWEEIPQRGQQGQCPSVRAAHGLELAGRSLYLLGGYSDIKQYAGGSQAYVKAALL